MISTIFFNLDCQPSGQIATEYPFRRSVPAKARQNDENFPPITTFQQLARMFLKNSQNFPILFNNFKIFESFLREYTFILPSNCTKNTQS
jgi:hypothetical protein